MIDDGRSADASSSANVRIRTLVGAEIPYLADIDRSANELFARWGHPEFESETYESVPYDIAIQAIAQGRLLACDVRVLGSDFELAGFLIMFDRPNGDTSIGQISMRVDRMGNGYGGLLLRAALDRCRRVGRRAVVLNTQSDVPWNRPWYERFGFVVVPTEEWDDDMHETVLEQTEDGLDWSTRVHMRLQL